MKMNKKVLELFKNNFKEPTEIQKITFNRDFYENQLIIAPTGSGKTEAVLFPIFSEIIDKKMEKICCLYITPLKSLNRDLLKRVNDYCNFLELDVDIRHGDTTKHQRKLQLEYPPHLLITTLEMFQAILTAKKLNKLLKNVRFVIIDEIHEVIDSKRGSQLIVSLHRLKRISPKFSLKVLSATIGNIEKVKKFFGEDLNVVESKEEKKYDFKVIYLESPEDRIKKVVELIESSKNALVFTNTRETCESLANRIKTDYNIEIEVHHSSLEREVRESVERKLKEGKLKAVFATSSMQLGIDIGSIDLVIQYMSPRQVSQLVQRVGRASHYITKVSRGIIIASNFDDILESYVIAKFSAEKKFEDFFIFEKPFDILLHQLIGILLEEREGLEKDFLFKFFKEISIYKNLSLSEFSEIVNIAKEINLIREENNKLIARKKSYKYYFQNLSTIPSKEEFKVFDSITNKKIGSLDSDFVNMDLEEGKSFILKGDCWKVISIDEDRKIVEVEKSEDIESALPSWKGELMEVPFEVSINVGKLRRELNFDINIINEEGIKKVKEIIEKQKSYSKIPDEKTILIDCDKNNVVINCCFGNRVNETLAILLSSFITEELGKKISYECGAYRIILKDFNDLNLLKKIIEILSNYNEKVERFLENFLPNTKIFKVKFVEVAKRFGIITNVEKVSNITIAGLMKMFSNSIVEREVLNEIITSKLDLNNTKKVLEMIKNKEIEVLYNNFLSPISEVPFEEKFGYVEISEYQEPIEKFKERLLNTRIYLVCANCKKYKTQIKVKEYKDGFRCPYCDSIFIAPMKNLEKEKDKNYVKTASNLLADKGKTFLIALAGRGVGLESAIRILSGLKIENEETLLKLIREEEKKYLKAKKYMKI